MTKAARKPYCSAILFTGHMVDLPSRARARFPPAMEPAASHEIAAAIDRQLDRVDVSKVIAISSLARGGDILFQEHAANHHLASYIVLPFEPRVFLKKSVLGVPTGDWEARFWRIWNRTPCKRREVVASSADKNPYEACNQRQMEIAQESADEIAVVALFDGTADGAGGTRDMIQRGRAAGGHIRLIDTKKLLARSSKTTLTQDLFQEAKTRQPPASSEHLRSVSATSPIANA